MDCHCQLWVIRSCLITTTVARMSQGLHRIKGPDECNQSALKIQKEQFETVAQDGLRDPCYNARIS